MFLFLINSLILLAFLKRLSHEKIACRDFFVYFFGGLEYVRHSYAYSAHIWFLMDLWIRNQGATNLASYPSMLVRIYPTQNTILTYSFQLWLSF
jgi:hypothetical protein